MAVDKKITDLPLKATPAAGCLIELVDPTNTTDDPAGSSVRADIATLPIPTAVASALGGKANSSHAHAAADITSGTIATARLGSGTASSSTFLRGDQTYAVPAGGGGGGATIAATSSILKGDGAGNGIAATAGTDYASAAQGGKADSALQAGDLAAWAGSTTVATVGTIVAGTWHGTAVADAYIASATAWNAKQAAGNYLVALTGDVAASGPGSASATLATVNGNVGSFTNASITVDAKGRITAAASGDGASLPSTTSLLKGNGSGGAVAATANTDYLAPSSLGVLIGPGATLGGEGGIVIGDNAAADHGGIALGGLADAAAHYRGCAIGANARTTHNGQMVWSGREQATGDSLAVRSGLQGFDSSSTTRDMAELKAAWIDPTSATRTARCDHVAMDWAGDRVGLSVIADGSAGRVALAAPASAPTDAHLLAGQASPYLDESAPALKFRVRMSDGTYKTATLALS